MQRSQPASTHEMVLAFITAEVDSPRFQRTYARALQALGQSRDVLIDRADIGDAVQNRLRAEVLGHARGYGRNQWLFTGFPGDVHWHREYVDVAEVGNLLYGNFDEWLELSGGTRRVADGARRARLGARGFPPARNAHAVAARISAGERFPALIAVARNDGARVLVEGHTRATAYAMMAAPASVDLLLGRSGQMDTWYFS